MKQLSMLFAMIFLFLPSGAHAVAYCTGTIVDTITYADGDLTIRGSWHTSFTRLCNLNISVNGIPPQTCWSWAAMVKAAAIESKVIGVYYASLGSSAECATLATYDNSPAPVYVRLIN